jgi:protein involved in polysaccharide export with SLBB domain
MNYATSAFGTLLFFDREIIMKKGRITYLHIFIVALALLFGFKQVAFSQEEYTIGIGDVLAISVWGESALDLEVVVRPDGMISYPLLDDIPVQGKTTLELKAFLTKKLIETKIMGRIEKSDFKDKKLVNKLLDEKVIKNDNINEDHVYFDKIIKDESILRERLEKIGIDKIEPILNLWSKSISVTGFIKDPRVTVIVRSINSLKVYVHGEVTVPGSYLLKEKASLADVVAMAGGIKADSADFLKALVMRDGKKLDVDFQKLFQEGDISQNINLKPGDTIFIPDNFRSRISVLGAVVTPGFITYRKGMTVLDAIMSMGGFTKLADPDDTMVIRKVDGVEKKIEVDMEDVMEKGDMEKNILLLPADKIIVEEKWY